MRAHRSIDLLLAATILFSQIVSGIHMAGHVHGPIVENAWQAPHPTHLTVAEHKALHESVSPTPVANDSTDNQAQLLASVSPVSTHDQAQTTQDLSCVIYHIYAGSHCVATGSELVLATTSFTIWQSALPSPAHRTLRAEHNTIRGPPAFS